MPFTEELVVACRRQFPALSRRVGEHAAVYFDGPAGTQVPQRVIEAISDYLAHHNANHGGVFHSSRESDVVLDRAHQAAADLLGASDPDEVYFGANMTSLTFALSRALAQNWKQGDEIIVTRLDHDANVTPWVLAAKDAGAEVKYVDIDPADCTLNQSDFRAKLSDRTKLVAIGCASNSVGSINPLAEMTKLAQEQGALVFADAVHYAPHARIDVQAWGVDFLACSAYKFFGPHVGILWGKRSLLESVTPYKLRPAPNNLPGRWMTGTQNHECIAGVLAAIDYLADIGRILANDDSLSRPAALDGAMQGIREYEQELVTELVAQLEQIADIKVWGITDASRFDERLPTVSITHARRTPEEIAIALDEQGIFVWHGNYYALQLTETLGLEPDGMVRIGLTHYNTPEEVKRLISALRHL